MYRVIFAAVAVSFLLLIATTTQANEYSHRDQGCKSQSCRAGLFGWRSYSAEERRNFPTCYGGYERYYGGFHANYFRGYPGNFDGLDNNRYGYGNGFAW